MDHCTAEKVVERHGEDDMLKCNYVEVHYCRMYAISPSLSHSRLRQVLALGNLESHRSSEIHIYITWKKHSSLAVW